MNDLTQYSDLLERAGIPLESVGTEEIALRRNDALAALAVLENGDVPVLGGDVYWLTEDAIEPAYANWHWSREPKADPRDEVKRSCAEAASYVARFPAQGNREPLFSLVLANPEASLEHQR